MRLPDQPFAGVLEDEWLRFVQKLIPHTTRAANIALYGRSLVLCYLGGEPPRFATHIDAAMEGTAKRRRVATNLLGRSTWQPDGTALDLAAEAIGKEPEFLLASPVSPTRARGGDSYCIYAVNALYRGARAVPVALARSHGFGDSLHDQTMHKILNGTMSVASNCRCDAPFLTCDTGISDYLIRNLAPGSHPFAAQVDPIWWHEHIMPADAYVALMKCPDELFARPDLVDVQIRPLEGGERARLIRMTYWDKPDSALYYVMLPDGTCFLVRPPGHARRGVHRQLGDAALLAERAAGLRDARPLAPLDLESFHGGDSWDRHATILQAVLAFWHVHKPIPDPPRGA